MSFYRIIMVVQEQGRWLLLNERFEVVGTAGTEATALKAAVDSGCCNPVVIREAA